MIEFIMGACVGLNIGAWINMIMMRATFRKLKAEIGSRESGNWE
jgi:hypothetical protein